MIRGLADSGDVTAVESDQFGEVSYIMLNESKPPFDNIKARRAARRDFDEVNTILNAGITTQATGPFALGNIGNLDDTGFPTYDRIAPRSWSRSTNPRPANRCRSRTRPPRPRRPSHRPSSSRSRPKRLA